MEQSRSSDKLFGNLALGLLVAGLLVPFIIGVFSEELAIAFGVTACLLALVLGIIGWKQKTGKVTVVAIVVLGIFSTGTYFLTRSKRTTAMKKYETLRNQAVGETGEPCRAGDRLKAPPEE